MSAIPSYRSVRRWRLHFRFHQRLGQPANSLAQGTAVLLCEQLSSDPGEVLWEARLEISTAADRYQSTIDALPKMVHPWVMECRQEKTATLALATTY